MMSPGNEAHLIARKPEAPGPLEFSGVRNKSLIKTPFQTQLLRETHFKKKQNKNKLLTMKTPVENQITYFGTFY